MVQNIHACTLVVMILPEQVSFICLDTIEVFCVCWRRFQCKCMQVKAALCCAMIAAAAAVAGGDGGCPTLVDV